MENDEAKFKMSDEEQEEENLVGPCDGKSSLFFE
jgi:hypothetical protein